MTIAAILSGKSGEVISLTRDMTVATAVALFAERQIGAAPVLDAEGALCGIFSERDVLHVLQARGPDALKVTIGGVMTASVITVTPAEPVIAALALMTQRRVRHLPVLDGGRLIGFVSIGDLVKYRIDRIEADAAAMRDYIQTA